MKTTFVKGLIVTALFSAGVAVGAWQQPASGTRREPQFKNGNVEVWKSIIMPNQPLALHRHDLGRTIVALKGGTLDVVDKDGKTLQQMTWETGKAYWLDADPPGQMHGDLNRTKEPIEVIVVQMLK
jgi:beta-alanine degradation protein BauB